MARPNRLKEIETEHNEPLEKLIPRKLNELGTMQAVANDLKTTLPTIHLWCKENNVTRRSVWTLEGVK